MGSKNTTTTLLALFLTFNLLFFALATAKSCDSSPHHSSKHKPKHKKHKHAKSPSNPPNTYSPPPMPFFPPPLPVSTPPLPFPVAPNPSPRLPMPSFSPPKPSPRIPTPYFSPPKPETCPRDALKLGVCYNALGGLVGIVAGGPPVKPCCSFFGGLVNMEAAVCLCTAIKANVFGLNLDIPVSISMILNACDRKVPPGFQCA